MNFAQNLPSIKITPRLKTLALHVDMILWWRVQALGESLPCDDNSDLDCFDHARLYCSHRQKDLSHFYQCSTKATVCCSIEVPLYPHTLSYPSHRSFTIPLLATANKTVGYLKASLSNSATSLS